jgi:CheY-like chemotaxis protein
MKRVDTSGWCVLVVDDEPDSVEIVRIVLRASGANVLEAHTGEEALAAFQKESPTVVLTDLSMPDMDGWQLLEAVRRRENKHNHIPVIALTAHAMAGDRERVMGAGFDGYLSKPLSMLSLLEDISKILTKT